MWPMTVTPVCPVFGAPLPIETGAGCCEAMRVVVCRVWCSAGGSWERLAAVQSAEPHPPLTAPNQPKGPECP